MKNRTWVEINIDNLLFNLHSIRKFLKDDTEILAAVKANAYGHDSIIISKELSKYVRYLGVASIDEAIELRINNINNNILILSPTLYSDIKDIINYNFIPNVYSFEYAKQINEYCYKNNKKIKVHIEVDTGMNRTGIDYRNAVESIINIVSLKNIQCEGIFSHFAQAEKNDSFTIEQINRFDIILNNLQQKGIYFKYKHFANSAAIVNIKKAEYNMVRPGIMLYGHYTAQNLKSKIQLKPIMSMKTKICQIKTLKKGDTISYQRTYKANRDMKVATIPIGYGDGYSRLFSNKAYMFVNNKRVPVIGNVCMDLTMIDISELENINISDTVEVFGDNITIDELSKISKLINYEILTGIGPRVPRIFIKNNNEYFSKNIMANANRRMDE